MQHKNLFLLTFFLFICGISPARAELTEEAIKDFIHKTTEISSGHVESMSPEDISAYLDTHLHKKARFKSAVQYNIPGFPTQETSMSLNKEEYIQGLEQGANALSDYDTDITIKSIKISKDGKRATVQTTGIERGSLPMANGTQTEFVPVEGSSSCNQILKWEDDVIQMYSAICSTVVTFQPFSN
ncbi:MAG: hypothetical protein KDJ35_03080 [Alphaproteobacteria bacterium]|nr:hypothetical protein [Alphaproteobacteria bacterium]